MGYGRTCKKATSERKGTALERSQLPADKVVSVLDHIREGCGIRATSRLTGVSRDTISRYIARAGAQSERDFTGPRGKERRGRCGGGGIGRRGGRGNGR